MGFERFFIFSAQLLLLAIFTDASISLLDDPNVEIVYINPDEKQEPTVNANDDLISMANPSSADDFFNSEYHDEKLKTEATSLLIEQNDEDDGDKVDRKRPSSTNFVDLFSTTSATIGTFSPLDCNTQPWSDCNILVSNKLPSGNDPLTIPCGQCYTFDVGGNVTLNGLNIEGKLMFPLNHKAVISTPYVIVQGELEITVDHAKIIPENIGTKFILTKTNAIYFKPTKTPNQNACDGTGGSCNLGVKPFVVAGGKVSINAMPETCASHTPIIEKIYTDPEYDYEDFSHFVELPEECPQSGLSFISYNFDDGNYGNWTGRDGAFMEVMDDGSVKVTNRRIRDRGPHLDITPLRPDLCLVPDQDYLFVARIKLDKADGSMVGHDSPCKAEGKNCPELRVIHDAVEERREYSHRKTDFHTEHNRGPIYGEFFYFTAIVNFETDELYPENAYTSIRIEGPEEDVDISVDSFDLFLPDEASYSDPNDLCYDLILNGDAEANGFHPYPMISNRYNNQLSKVEENGNKFWRLFDRDHHGSSIKYNLNDICLTQGLTYLFSSKVRYHHSPGFVGGSEPYLWKINYKQISDGHWRERYIVECAAQSVKDGWVTCTGEFMVDAEMAEATELNLDLRLTNSRDGDKYDLDFDDIFIRYHKGYVSELVVDNQDVSCWGNDADVHVTTSTYYNYDSRKPPGLVSQINNVYDNGDGTATLQLSEAATLPIISSEENSDYAAEIALLTRNIVIKGDEGEDRKGGYMQVLHTPNITQIIQGVEFQNMGRRSEMDRYALQFVYSDNVEGTLISRNSFRQSNQRCVVIEGTSNITISHNVGYETNGHCIYIGFESVSNLITKNLVSDTKSISYQERLHDESDYSPCAFINRYNPNDYISNIAVAGERDGFCFTNSYRTRLENGQHANLSVRKLKLGAFEKNTAKSFWYHGFYFAHHESKEEIFIVEAKAIKNRYMGIFVIYSYDMTIRDSLVAENAEYGIDVKWTDNIRIEDTIIKGYTSETKALVKPPYFRMPCVSSSYSNPPTGLRLPTEIHSWNRKDDIGAYLTNVRFMDFDHSDECASIMPLRFYAGDNRHNHFSYASMFRNVTMDGGKIMDALSSDQQGVKDIILHDVDGSSDPLGQATHGMLVSNVKSLTTFANNSCVRYPEGASYCADSCYRTVSFFVDQTNSQKFDLSVTRKTDGEKAIVPFTYKYDDDSHRKHYSENYRSFSVSLPAGAYRIEFLEDLNPIWPGFVLPRWEGSPECEGHVFAENITVVEPYQPCEELTVNGDMEQGVNHWYHRNYRSEIKYGFLMAVEEGINGSTALRHYKRTSPWSGIGQNLDTRCLHQSLNEFYEILLYFRLEHNQDNSTFMCDPFSGSLDVHCPYITFKQERYVNEGTETKYKTRVADLVLPYTLDDYNLIQGVFKVDESVHAIERLFMYIELAPTNVDIIIDNVSVKKLPRICGDDLIRNGNFDENSKFWKRIGSVHLDIESLPNKNLKVFKKKSYWEGIKQDLYIDKDCGLQPKQRFHVTAKFKLEVASSGAPIRCDRTVWFNELECGRGLIWAEDENGAKERWHGVPIAIATEQYQGWDMLSGIWTVTEKEAFHDSMYFRLWGSNENMNVFFDDVHIIPLPHSCSSLVLNGDFEEGDSRFWEVSWPGSIDIDISTLGAGASSYSLMTNKYTSHRVYQDLDTRCIVEDQEFLISAKFRLLNATDLVSGVECSPSIKNRHDKKHCPTVAIYGKDCAANDIRFYFFNEIDHIQWDPNGFNDFEKVFPITADLASCEIVQVEVGHYVHDGRILLVDDIQISQRTTSPPTVSPTFSPTEGKNTGPTNQPTIKTDSPTTTNLITCPSVGDAPLAVGSGSVMLSVVSKTSLCTLTKSVTSSVSGETILIPIARSYDKNRWEQAAGEQAASILGGKDIMCYSAGCQLELQGHGPSEQYLLSSSSYSLSESNEYARFLETSTFGITQADLDSFDASPNSVQDDIIDWISIQMNVSRTPLSSHREYWRSRINSRLPTSTNIGTPDHPCDKYSRWRRVSFVRNDATWHVKKKLRVVNLGSTSAGPFKLQLNRWTRTVVDILEIINDGYSNYTFDPTYEYELCSSPEDYISNGRLYIRLEPENEDEGPCVAVTNPFVNLDGYESNVNNIFNLPDGSLNAIDQQWNSDEELIFQLQTSLFDKPSFSTICTTLPSVPEFEDEPIFGKLSDGTWLMFDPRLDLIANTLTSPQQDGGKNNFKASGGDTLCSNAPRTFLNEDQCRVSSDACRPSANSQVDILLDNFTIAALNNLTGRYTYAIKGLLVKYDGMALDHPCTPGLRSRWERKNITECSPTDLYGNTTISLTDLLLESGDRNPYIRDITFPKEGKICDAGDYEPEIEMKLDGVCWKRVHDEHLSVFDMTYWVDRHPGGAYNIKKWSINNGTILIYPSLLPRRPHGMANWNNNWHKFTYVGRFGDSLKFGDLPNDLRSDDVTKYFDPSDDGNDSKILVCGSPGEVSSNRDKGFFFDVSNDYSTATWLTWSNRKYVWIMIALNASDQLRQRVAWALSQIVVVVKDAIANEAGQSEWFLAYYDIFVRNAFGNYRDVLREVSYNSLMAENLSFLGSKSAAYMLERYNVQTSADENFAREIMQLFTMGLMQLNMDGSPKLDSSGNTILSYTNDDIMSFSRAWTGFDLQSRRGNIEGWNNRIDPMRINPEWRDRFPKSDTTGGYIGDTYPICYDSPSRSFLRKGATFRFLGSSSLPELMTDPADFATQETVTRVILDNSSSLRKLLCNEDSAGVCSYQNSVTLSNNYDCTGIECKVDTIRVVQVDVNSFYEYVPEACINLIFYNNPVKISPHYSANKVMCADPRLPMASEACCSLGNHYATRNSNYSGERMTFESAKTRCKNASKGICNFDRVEGESFLNKNYFWTAKSCLLQVKVKRDGRVAIVHRPSEFLERVGHVADDNQNYFRVYWSREGDYPIVDNDCDNVCEVLEEGSCLCNTGVIERAVFNGMPSSKDEALEKLSIGAFNPRIFDSETYSSLYDEDKQITAHLIDNVFNSETIFEFDDENGRIYFMRNIDSSVYLRGIESGYTGQSFRNPPQFMSFIPTETNLRDAQYETEATLDHYFFHDNTAPFIATRLIQRLTTSNPTPRYIETVSNAFKSGSYTTGGTSFGSGEYGDLAATIAAIYLDSAARNVLLDEDTSSGGLREPILKVISVLRSMEFESKFPVTVMKDLFESVGQMAHEFTTVFSFFLPEFTPYGRVGDASLVSPEATLLDMPKIIGLMNGLTSLAKYGLSDCEGGWGSRRWCQERIYTPSIDGVLEFHKVFTNNEFSFETFEGPSLKGGLDNTWVGRYFDENYGVTTVDPLDNINHVVHFPKVDWSGHFFSEPIANKDENGNPYVVKFRYLGNAANSGGCIGYIDSTHPYLNTQTWALCDYHSSIIESQGLWQSCQFIIPAEIESFHIIVGDVRSPGGDAYFDDIQLATGNETTCTGVNVPKRNPLGQAEYSTLVVDKLSTLLTAGRLSSETKAVITDAFDNAGSAKDGLRVAQQLIFSTGEFHTTNIVKSTDQPRENVSFEEPTGEPYRAVIFLMLSGGCDSFNMLVPHTCSNDLYESYLDVRQQVAIPKNRLLPISTSDQVCAVFGLHPELSAIQSLYDDGDLLFFANTGVLSRPVNKDNYYRLTNTQLFAHNHMQRETKRIDPYDISLGTGVLGRMSDILTRKGRNVGSFSVDRFSVALVGQPGVTNAPFIVDRNGIPNMFFDDILLDLDKLHNNSHIESGIFADTWSSSLMKSLGVNQLLRAELANVTINAEFPHTSLGVTLETVSKLIVTKDLRGVDVDAFYVEMGGFDTHSDVEENLNNLFNQVNSAISSFSQEMKSRDLWDNVTIIQTSDFARTLNPNGGDGTDHAWGGNYMMMGGSVKGGKILGEYPEDITEEGPWTLGRGRMIPTTPWEVPFRAIARWLGIESSSDMEEVCPNLRNFDSISLDDPELILSNSLTIPTMSPTSSSNPTIATSTSPSSLPSSIPSIEPSDSPTSFYWPSKTPSQSVMPSALSSFPPSDFPSTKASSTPSAWPSNIPSKLLSSEPNSTPSAMPSLAPSSLTSLAPSINPSSIPSIVPSFNPSVVSSLKPTELASSKPSDKPSKEPSASPSVSKRPSEVPSVAPSSCPSDCYGDAETNWFPIAGQSKRRKCSWASNPKHKEKRCQMPEVALNCCKTCCASCVGDAAGKDNFIIYNPEREFNCAWVAEDAHRWCAEDSVAIKCCKTCSDALATSYPSSVPSFAPTDCDDRTDNFIPSNDGLKGCSSVNQIPEGCKVYASDCPQSCGLCPSLAPSVMPSLLPSSAPSGKIENVALQKPTSQSSDARNAPSSKAVDGYLVTLSRTKWGQDPHWHVDLEGDYKIKVIKLHLNGQKLSRMNKFILKILDGEVEVWKYQYPGVPTSSSIVIDVPETTAVGNKVQIALKGKRKALELREVEVMAISQ